jgi:hypothetical protein
MNLPMLSHAKVTWHLALKLLIQIVRRRALHAGRVIAATGFLVADELDQRTGVAENHHFRFCVRHCVPPFVLFWGYSHAPLAGVQESRIGRMSRICIQGHVFEDRQRHSRTIEQAT